MAREAIDALFSGDQPPSSESAEPTTDTDDQPLGEDQPTTDVPDADEDGASEQDESDESEGEESEEDEADDSDESGEGEAAESEHTEAPKSKREELYQTKYQREVATREKAEAELAALKAQMTIERHSKPKVDADGKTAIDRLAEDPEKFFTEREELIEARLEIRNQLKKEEAALEAFAAKNGLEEELEHAKSYFDPAQSPGFEWPASMSPQKRSQILMEITMGKAAQKAADVARKNGEKAGIAKQKQRMKEVSVSGGASAPLKSGKSVEKNPPATPMEAEWDSYDEKRSKRSGLDKVF